MKLDYETQRMQDEIGRSLSRLMDCETVAHLGAVDAAKAIAFEAVVHGLWILSNRDSVDKAKCRSVAEDAADLVGFNDKKS